MRLPFFRPGLVHSLQLLLDRSEQFQAVCKRKDRSTIDIRFTVANGSGKPGTVFELVATCDRGDLVVKEHDEFGHRRLLPAACAERHINGDGSFCLFWKDGDPIAVIDVETADRWWRNLFTFLKAQIYANRHRTWPNGAGRAHGNAAFHEAKAEQIAAEFGPQMFNAFKARHLRLLRRKVGMRGLSALRIEQDGHRLFGMWEGSDKVVNLRAACPCARQAKRPLPIRKCGNHADLAAEFVRRYAAMEDAERKFLQDISLAGHQCCGTMDVCQLKTHNENELHNACRVSGQK